MSTITDAVRAEVRAVVDRLQAEGVLEYFFCFEMEDDSFEDGILLLTLSYPGSGWFEFGLKEHWVVVGGEVEAEAGRVYAELDLGDPAWQEQLFQVLRKADSRLIRPASATDPETREKFRAVLAAFYLPRE
ncbi:MAG: hypothetical protein U0790_27335 [Isosphaeraceae bacterium]